MGVEEAAASVENEVSDLHTDYTLQYNDFPLMRLIIFLLSVSLSVSIALLKVSFSSAVIVAVSSSAFNTDSRERSWRFSCLRLKFSAAYRVIFG